MIIYKLLIFFFLVAAQVTSAQELSNSNESSPETTSPEIPPFDVADIHDLSFYQDTQTLNSGDSNRVISSLTQISDKFGLIGKIILLSNEKDRSPKEIAEYVLSSDKGIDFVFVGTASGWHTAFQPVAGLNDQEWINSIVPVIDGKFQEGDTTGGLILFVSEIETRVTTSTDNELTESSKSLENVHEDESKDASKLNTVASPEEQYNSDASVDGRILSSTFGSSIGLILLLISAVFLFAGNRLSFVRRIGAIFATNPFHIERGIVTKLSELEAITSFHAYSSQQSHGYNSSTRYFVPLMKIGNTTLQNHKITREIYENINVGDECVILTMPTRLFWIIIVITGGKGSNALYEQNRRIVWCRNVTQETESVLDDLGLDKGKASFAFRQTVAPNLAIVGAAAFWLALLIGGVVASTELLTVPWFATIPLGFAILCATIRASADIAYESFLEVVTSART